MPAHCRLTNLTRQNGYDGKRLVLPELIAAAEYCRNCIHRASPLPRKYSSPARLAVWRTRLGAPGRSVPPPCRAVGQQTIAER